MPKSFRRVRIKITFPEAIAEGVKEAFRNLVQELETSVPSRPESAYRHETLNEPHLSQSFRYGTRVGEGRVSGWLYSLHPRAGEFLNMWITGRREGFIAGHISGRPTFIEKFGGATGEENLTVGKYGDLGVYVKAGTPIRAAIVEPIIGQKLDEFSNKLDKCINNYIAKRGILKVKQ